MSILIMLKLLHLCNYYDLTNFPIPVLFLLDFTNVNKDR